MPEELCQVSPKSHYGVLASHSDPSPLWKSTKINCQKVKTKGLQFCHFEDVQPPGGKGRRSMPAWQEVRGCKALRKPCSWTRESSTISWQKCFFFTQVSLELGKNYWRSECAKFCFQLSSVSGNFALHIDWALWQKKKFKKFISLLFTKQPGHRTLPKYSVKVITDQG